MPQALQSPTPPGETMTIEALLDELPAAWLRELPGEVVNAVLLALAPRERAEPTLAALT